MIGINRNTGAPLSGLAHIVQSINVILSTPLGSRVKRRTFGSQLPDLLDAPVNASTKVLLYAAAAAALMRWEPRIDVQRVAIDTDGAMAGHFVMTVSCRIKDSGQTTTVRVPISTGASA